MSGPNPQPPAATLGAPLDTPSPATQVFGALEVAPYQVVYRQGATRGTGATDVRGPICGTWAQVLAMLQSMWLVAANQGTGQTLRLVCDGNDPLNPNGASSGIVSVPAGGPYALPPNVALDGGTSAEMVIEAGATFADDFFWSEVNVSIVCATGALAATPFTIVTTEIFCRLGPGITIGGGDNTILLNVTNSQNAVFYSTGQSSGYDPGAFESQDGTGRVDITCITSGSVALGAFTQTAFPIPVGQAEIQLDASSTNEEVSYAAAVLLLDAASAVTLAGPPVMHAETVDAGIYEALSPSIAFLPGAALPSGPQYGRVATSWGDLTAQIADSNSTQQMIFVNTNGAIPFVVPSSGTEFYWPVFVGTNAYTAGFPTVDCGSAGFTWFSSIEFQDFNLTSTAGGVAQLDATVGEAFVRLSGYGSIKSATATACVDVSGAVVVAISLEDDAQLGDGTNPAISGTGVGVCSFFVRGSAQIAANSLDPSILAAGSLSVQAQSSGVTIDASYHPQTFVSAGVTLVGNGSPLVTGLNGNVGAFYVDTLTGTLWANPQGNEWVPAVAQSGTTALVNGVSPAIPAYLAAGNAIVVTYNTPATSVGGTLGVLQAALANRVNGAPGSFTVTSVLPTTLAANVTDQSTVDWMVVQ